jgi:hypothetical protein
MVKIDLKRVLLAYILNTNKYKEEFQMEIILCSMGIWDLHLIFLQFYFLRVADLCKLETRVVLFIIIIVIIICLRAAGLGTPKSCHDNLRVYFPDFFR